MHPATWELFQVKLAARKLLEARELSPSLLRELGLHLPDPRSRNDKSPGPSTVGAFALLFLFA